MASAERAEVDWFLTCDGRLIRKAQHGKLTVGIKVSTPIIFVVRRKFLDGYEQSYAKARLASTGWKALVAKLGVANATRVITDLSAGEEDYTRLRKKLFAQKRLMNYTLT